MEYFLCHLCRTLSNILYIYFTLIEQGKGVGESDRRQRSFHLWVNLLQYLPTHMRANKQDGICIYQYLIATSYICYDPPGPTECETGLLYQPVPDSFSTYRDLHSVKQGYYTNHLSSRLIHLCNSHCPGTNTHFLCSFFSSLFFSMKLFSKRSCFFHSVSELKTDRTTNSLS